ncbi:hypothetical protein E0L20_07335 [Enterobacter wuhouensis]|uniref:HTH luxR-type domain-containing protein n=6 Tax=Enterobacterales TaxID=91347 RepID=A0A4R0GAY2_9ENTR|nr:hypothetical protein E0L20_07335 [Enterobacter wuhouensis]
MERDMDSVPEVEKQASLRQLCFTFGTREIARQLKIRESYTDYKFIDFDERILNPISTYDFALEHCWGKCVLVSSKKLLPLAIFYYHHFWFVSTVIEADRTLDFSVEWLSSLNGIKGLISSMSRLPCLSWVEVVILDGFMAGKSISIIARSLGKHPKTVYGYRKRIAVKMGLKKLENLITLTTMDY